MSKTLTIVIPVYNEETRIKETIKTLSEGFSFSGLKLQKIVFVNDGSTDKSLYILRANKLKLEKALNIKVENISYPVNQGKGFAIKTGVLTSKSDYTLFFDADLSTPINQLDKFLPFIRENSPIIIGTRKNELAEITIPQPIYRQLLGRGFTFLANQILQTQVTDFTCGFKLFSQEAGKEIFSRITINRWSYDSEIIYLATQLKYPIKEVPVVWENKTNSKVNLIKDLPKSFIDLIQIRLSGIYLQPEPCNEPSYSPISQ